MCAIGAALEASILPALDSDRSAAARQLAASSSSPMEALRVLLHRTPMTAWSAGCPPTELELATEGRCASRIFALVVGCCFALGEGAATPEVCLEQLHCWEVASCAGMRPEVEGLGALRPAVRAAAAATATARAAEAVAKRQKLGPERSQLHHAVYALPRAPAPRGWTAEEDLRHLDALFSGRCDWRWGVASTVPRAIRRRLHYLLMVLPAACLPEAGRWSADALGMAEDLFETEADGGGEWSRGAATPRRPRALPRRPPSAKR